MSAYIVEEKTINRIVTWIERERDNLNWYLKKYDGEIPTDPQGIGQLLLDLNAYGFEQRYNEKVFTDYYKFKIEPASDIQTFKSLRCLIYQCSEGDTEEKPLYKFLEELSNHLAYEIVHNLPEYEQALWG